MLLHLFTLIAGLMIIPAYSQTASEDYMNNGIAKAKKQDYKGAIQDFNKEIKTNPKNYKVYLYRAYAKEATLDYKSAIQDYSQAIVYKPDSAGIYYDRALARYSVKDLKNACLDWKKSVELGMPDANYMIKQYCK